MTPDEWNTKFRPEPFDTREMAPVQCPRCGSKMFFPFDDHAENDRGVRCVSKQSCVQTTIRNPMYVVG